jgi:hypothetical protein
MQVIPRFAELALDFRMERSIQLLNRNREFLPAALAVELLPALFLVSIHTGQI